MPNKNENDTFISGQKPKSRIINSTFINRLNSLFGFRTLSNEDRPETTIEKQYGIKFVRVDLDNPAYRVKNAAIGSIFKSQKLDSTVEHYLDSYLRDTTVSYSDIQDRLERINELSFMYYNDVFISKCCHTVADEATQLDMQDRIISIESSNINFVEHTYNLLNSWGITPTRLNKVCFDLELYGEAFWAHKIGLNGIEKIKPLEVNTIIERLEFSPIHVAKFLAERDGWMNASKDRHSKVKELISLLKSKATNDEAENLADMFDDKLLGYELHNGIMAPPWLISHFRFNADHSEFYPYGRPPLIQCLAPFKQAHSTMALQGLARAMSFPITMYKVSTPKGITPPQAFDLVNNVRQQYDNLGVTPAGAGSEVYTVNTKVWLPNDLLEIDVKESKCDIDFIEDLENYQKRVAYAANIPLSYLDPNSESSTYVSGISLMEQYKPFARHVYSIQSVVLETIGMLIRMHYAITGEFDYNTPFILSMRFPAIEMSDDKRAARQSSLELSQSIVDLLKTVLGISEEDPLPEDVVTDILSKYSFLDPTEIQKWMRLSAFLKPKAGGGEGGGGDGEFDADFGDDGGGDIDTDDAGGGEEMPENKKAINAKRLKEKEETLLRKQILREKKLRQLEHMKEIAERYTNAADDIYMHFVESNRLTDWSNTNTKKHCLYVPKILESSPVFDSFKVLSSGNEGRKNKRLTESEIANYTEGIKIGKQKSNQPLDKARIKLTETVMSASAAADALRSSGVVLNKELKDARKDLNLEKLYD